MRLTSGYLRVGFVNSIKKGNKVNSMAFEFRTLRAVYNRAIKEGLAKKELYPFDKFKIKTEKIQKRALSKDEIILIRDIDLDDFPGQKKPGIYSCSAFIVWACLLLI